MKTYFNCSIIALLLFSIFSCKKNNLDTVATGETKLKFVNASNVLDSLSVSVDDETLNNLNLGFGTYSNYLKITSGKRRVTFTNSTKAIKDTILNFIPSLTYTTFLISDKNGKEQIVSYEDNLSNTTPSNAKIKLINLSPFYGTGINVSLQGGSQFIIGLAYKEASNYYSIDPDVNLRYNVVGSGNIKTLPEKSIEAGKIYTIWFSGTTAANLQAYIIQNN